MRLIERRLRQQPKAEHVRLRIFKRQRSHAMNRHTTTITVPPILFYAPTQERPSYIRIKPAILLYNSEILERPPYKSIREIRAIHNNEWL